MRVWNAVDARLYRSRHLAPRRVGVLEVAGRRTGRVTSVPLVVVERAGAEYVVSMLGPEANWVRNVRAAGGRATLRRGGQAVAVTLERVPAAGAVPVLHDYLDAAPGARPHLGVGRRASAAELHRLAERHPVFRLSGRGGS